MRESSRSLMKSVCILLQNHYEIDIRVRRKAEALVAAGYSVDVLALRSANSKSPTYTLEGVNVYTISLGKKRASLFRYLYEYVAFFVWAFFKLASLQRKKHYAIVDVNNLPDFLVFAGAWAKWKGAKIVFDMHEITPEFYISKYKMAEDSWMIRWLEWVERASFNFADHVITINEPIQRLLESRGLRAAKSTVIMNSVDEALFAHHSSNKTPARQDSDQDKFVMMYHGTLTHIYGLDIAIEAFGKAATEMPRAELWVLGNGPEKKALQELAEKSGLEAKVKFIGSVLPEEIPRWLSRCDIGVLATRRDIFLDFSFSNKLSEYIIMSKAVISSRLKAIRHYFSEESLAFFEPNDSSDLAKQMMRMYNEPQRRARFAARGKEEYAPISWSIMKERYLVLMAELTGERVPRSAESVESAGPLPAVLPR